MSSPYTFKSTGPSTRPTRIKPIPSPQPPSPTRSRSSSLSSTTSFTSAVSTHNHDSSTTTDTKPPTLPRFTTSEETQMLTTSNTLKATANRQFASKDFSSAISTYDKAIAELPVYLEYELAVLQSNISACHMGLLEWREAVESAERGLDCLEREMPMPKVKEKEGGSKKEGGQKAQGIEKISDDDAVGQIVELPDDTTDDQAADLLRSLNLSDQRKADITRIRSKLLLRRARSKVMLCESSTSTKPTATTTLDTDDPVTSPVPKKAASPFSSKEGDPPSHWSNLSAALADYSTLSTPPFFSILPASDRKTVTEMLRTLPPRVEAAKKKEVDEMMGKLKELGNGILKPFGLSTDMFKMTQDPNTGGWSMGFDGKAGK